MTWEEWKRINPNGTVEQWQQREVNNARGMVNANTGPADPSAKPGKWSQAEWESLGKPDGSMSEWQRKGGYIGGKDSNRVALGSLRTFAKVGDKPLTYASWIEAVREGKTFITNGPLLSFEVGERIRASAECAAPFVKLEIVVDGQPIATEKPVESSGRCSAKIEIPIPENANWIAARCIGGPSPLYPDAVHFAHTSPVSLAGS